MPKQPNEANDNQSMADSTPKPESGTEQTASEIRFAEPAASDESNKKGQAYRSWMGRFFAVAVGIVPLFLLGVTTQLTPSQAGLGTHHQLGLPPCSARVILGIRCPACGMTTSWAHFVRGSWLTSLRTNMGGFLLALYSFPLAFVCIQAARRGVLPDDQVQRRLIFWMLTIAGITLIDWIFRLAMEHFA